MPFVNWTHKEPLVGSRNYYIEEVREFNRRMIEAGLIDYNNNTTAIDNIENSTPYSSSATTVSSIFYRTFVTLYYRLPVGDNSITVSDEEIISEGYSDVPCYLKIRFYLSVLSSGNYTVVWGSNSTKMHNLGLLSASITISKTGTFNTPERCIVYTDTTYSGTINSTDHTYNSNSPFVSLSANSLVVSWMDSKVNTTSTYPNGNGGMAKLMFTIYRDNGVIDLMMPYNQPSALTQPYQPMVYTYISDDICYTTSSPDRILQNCNDDFINVESDGTIHSLETYSGHNVDFRVNPTLIRTMGVSNDRNEMQNTIVFTTVRLKYKGHIVKMRYIVYGHISYNFRWAVNLSSTTNYYNSSYLLLAQEHEPVGV